MDIEAKPFYRYISAKRLMERWSIDFVELRQIPIPAFIQTKGMDYSTLNPYSENCGKAPNPFGAIKKVPPVTKEDFNHVMYDIYSVEQYEYLHPEMKKSTNETEATTSAITFESDDPEEQLNEILKRIIPDIDLFYDSFNKVVRHHHYDDEPDYIKFAEEAYSDIQFEMEILIIQDIKGVFEKSEISPHGQYRVKGKLAKNMVSRLVPGLSKLAANAQNLKTRMNSLRKSVESQ